MKKYVTILLLIFIVFISGCKKLNLPPIYEESSFYQVEKLKVTKFDEVIGSKDSGVILDRDFSNAFLDFSYKTASELLEFKNIMISPVSYFYALSALAEVTSDEARDEITAALGLSDISLLRKSNQDLFKKLTYENEISTLQLANSIWLRDDTEYSNAPLKVLRDYYYVSSFGVNFSSSEDKAAIGQWVSDNTGGNLGEGAFDDLSPQTMFVLINTIYFYDEWVDKFNEDLNYEAEFIGSSEPATYMRQRLHGSYIEEGNYIASALKFKNGLNIRFVAPNTNEDLNDILSSEAKLKSALEFNPLGFSLIDYEIPKFSYFSNFNLLDYTENIGIKKVLSPSISSFKDFVEGELFVSSIIHETFIKIDESGGEAAAYTSIGAEATSVGSKVELFRLNKPFIYAIYSGDYPLFIGVVINPSF